MSYSSTIRYLTVVFILLVSFSFVFPNSVSNNLNEGTTNVQMKISYKSISSILILKNSDFTLSSCYSQGDGSAGNPYILENCIINNATDKGVDIENVNAHFIIQNIWVNGTFYLSLESSGFYIRNTTNGLFRNNIATYNNATGFYVLYDSNNNTFVNNTVEYNVNNGFNIKSASNNTFINNNISFNLVGLYSIMSSDNYFQNNTIKFNSIGFYIGGSKFKVINNTFGNNDAAIELYGNNHTILSNEIENSSLGIMVQSGVNITIKENQISNCSSYAIALYLHSKYNTISNNTVYGNSYGIILYLNSTNNDISNNTAFNNSYGFSIQENSASNTLSNNNASNNTNGYYMYNNASYNILVSNNAYNNSNYGFYFVSSSNNTLINDTAQSNGISDFKEVSSSNTYVNNTQNNNSSSTTPASSTPTSSTPTSSNFLSNTQSDLSSTPPNPTVNKNNSSPGTVEIIILGLVVILIASVLVFRRKNQSKGKKGNSKK